MNVLQALKAKKDWANYTALAGMVGVLFELLRLLPEDNIVRTFFLNGWYIQVVSSWMFFVGLLYTWEKWNHLKIEQALMNDIFLPEMPFTKNQVEELIQTAPQAEKETIIVRRFLEVLQGTLHGEDLMRLNVELLRRDIDQIERGHAILNSLKNLIPLVGYMGTVIGLSIGMVQFPDISDIDAMRMALKGFAMSLSMKFNTTLLALAYTIILILIASILKDGEESLVTELDKSARELIWRLRNDLAAELVPESAKTTTLNGDVTQSDDNDNWQDRFVTQIRAFGESLSATTTIANQQLASNMNDNMQEIIVLLREINTKQIENSNLSDGLKR